MSSDQRWIDVSDAARICGVSASTLRRWISLGKLPDKRHPTSGRHLFQIADLEPFAIYPPVVGSRIVLYARVSSRRQQADGDLDRQIQQLRTWADQNRPGVEQLVFSDVASGLADNRRGFWAAIAACQSEAVHEFVVTHADRLARFGVVTIQKLLAGYNIQILMVSDDPDLDQTAESELVRDMLAIITSFSGRLYGQRSAKAARLRTTMKTQIAARD